jgi:hypothetical protein
MTTESAHTHLTNAAPGTVIDCDTCVVRGDACGDCVIAVLLGAPPELQADEQRALGVLADAGLVPPLRLVEPDEPDDPGDQDAPPGRHDAAGPAG